MSNSENTGFIITLAYPETVVKVANEWYSPLLRLIGIGKKNYIRAGHAALVLIDKATGVLEYYDFGRYITPEPMGRVRGKDTDNELNFDLVALIKDDTITNINDILVFFATQPKLTHGEGKLVASVCNAVNYNNAKRYITALQNKHFMRYAAFKKSACNCARFVTDSLIASVTNTTIKKKLEHSKWFTPSTVGNALLADTQGYVYNVLENADISEYTGTKLSENLHCFLDTLKDHEENLVGSLQPKPVSAMAKHAQWLSGIAAGAWFELYETEISNQFRFRRISPHNNIDCDALFMVNDNSFNYNAPYTFIHYSNCKFFNILQNNKEYHFSKI